MSDKTCPKCGNSFTCDIENGKDTCWCFELPNVIPLDNIPINDTDQANCLCPDCLQKLIKKQIES